MAANTTILPVIDVNTTIAGVATEATLADVKTAVESIATEDFATETTLDAVKTSVELLDDVISTNVHTGLKELNIVANGHVCAENSTVTELGAGGVFTGSAWQDCLNYGTVVVSVFADKASATNGMVIQWSADGTNIMDTDVFTISANIGKTFSFGTASRYIRVVYTNGADAQGSFILQTMLKPGYTKPSSHRIEDNLNGQDDAELVKAILAARNPAGNYLNIDCTTGGNLKVSLEEIDGALLDQKTMAGSFPVVIASDQTAIPVSGTLTVNTTDVSALALESGGNLDTIAGDTTSIDAKIPALWDTDKIPVNVMNTDTPLRWDTQEYSEDSTSITIVYKFSTATVMTRVITWASAAAKTAGSLPSTNVVTLAGA